MMVATEGLVPRLLAQEVEYTAARAGVIGRRPGNPFGVAMRREGALPLPVAKPPQPAEGRVGDPLHDNVLDLGAALRAFDDHEQSKCNGGQ